MSLLGLILIWFGNIRGLSFFFSSFLPNVLLLLHLLPAQPRLVHAHTHTQIHTYTPKPTLTSVLMALLPSFNKTESETVLVNVIGASPRDDLQGLGDLLSFIVPERAKTLSSLCYDFVINVYIFLIFWTSHE
uniref:Uncharacterized protein n=1 Tax=Anguilla anguilla TaxID=7936 RepID=A0A0E9X0I2_ANGAN